MLLELREPLVDAPPTGGDEIDEERKIVDAGVPLHEHVPLEPFEPADHVVHEPADLRELPRHWARFGGDALLDRRAELLRQSGLQLGRRRRELLESLPRAFEDRFEVAGLRPRRGGLRQPLVGALECVVVHGFQE